MNSQTVQIHAADGTWVVRAGGAVIAETSDALKLHEGDFPAVVYFPRKDIGMAFLEPSDATFFSKTLGGARYFHIAAKSGLIRDAAWCYEAPNPEATRIADHVAFFGDIVAVEQV
jgi:uncharacterized protein (DUF427 family)